MGHQVLALSDLDRYPRFPLQQLRLAAAEGDAAAPLGFRPLTAPQHLMHRQSVAAVAVDSTPDSWEVRDEVACMVRQVELLLAAGQHLLICHQSFLRCNTEQLEPVLVCTATGEEEAPNRRPEMAVVVVQHQAAL